jgi:hypothetical protein
LKITFSQKIKLLDPFWQVPVYIFSPTPTVFYDNKLLKEVKEYNYLGNTIDYKGNVKRYIQELAKKGLKVLFSVRKLFSNFEHLPVNLSCKLFDTLMPK